MANTTIYLDALLQFDRPASVKEVYQKAQEMFGPMVKGDRTSARSCLERYLGTGKVVKENARYYATKEAADPIGGLSTRIKTLEVENKRLRDENEQLLKRLEGQI
jgi:hypothetical protein